MHADTFRPTPRRALRPAALVLLTALFAASCGGAVTSNSITDFRRCSGGSCTASNEGLAVTVPRGAADESFNLEIKIVDSPGPGNIGLTYEVGPEGLRFENPDVRPKLSFDVEHGGLPEGVDPFSLMVARFDGGDWVVLDPRENGADDAGLIISALADRFGFYSLVAGRPRTGVVSGAVRSGEDALVGAEVSLSNAAGDEVDSTVTEPGGMFSFTGLGPGSYTLNASLAGFLSEAQSFRLRAGELRTSDLTLTIDPATPGSIFGVITGAEDALVEGAMVTLEDGEGAPVASATSDAEGNYELSEVPAGDYEIVVTAARYLPVRQAVSLSPGERWQVNVSLELGLSGLVGDVSDARTELPVTTGLIVRLRDTLGDEIATQTLTSEARFEFGELEAGRVTLEISAVALNAYESFSETVILEPGVVSELDVVLTRARTQLTLLFRDEVTRDLLVGADVVLRDGETVIAEGTTPAPDGHLIFEDLVDGEYTMNVTAEGYAPLTESVEARWMQPLQLGFELTPLLGGVRGTVTGPDGPVVGATVRLFGLQDLLEAEVTDDAGAFEISAVEPGDYTIDVLHEAFLAEVREITVTGGVTVDANFLLEAFAAGIEGRVTSAHDGAPLAGATLRLLDGLEVEVTAESIANGSYHFDGFAEGDYRIEVTHPDYQTVTRDVLTTDDLLLTEDFALPALPGGINATVRDASSGSAPDHPLGATVRLYFDADGSLVHEAPLVAGRFEIRTLAPGAYTLVVETDGDWAPWERYSEALIIEPNRIVTPAVSLVRATVSLALQIDDAVSGSAVDQPSVVLRQDGQPVVERTGDTAGAVRIDGLDPGDYDLELTHPDYDTIGTEISVQWAQLTELDFTMTPSTGTVAGRVSSSPTQVAIDAAQLRFLDDQDAVIAEGNTDAQGDFSIEVLPGSWRVEVSADGHEAQILAVEIVAGQTTPLDVALVAVGNARIQGQVRDTRGDAPVAGAQIVVELAGHVVAELDTDVNGQFVVEALAAGLYSVRASKTGYNPVSASESFLLGDDETQNTELTLRSLPASISGSIFDAATGLPITGIAALVAGEVTVGSVITPGGLFNFEDLAPGDDYLLTVSASGYFTDLRSIQLAVAENLELTIRLTPPPGVLEGVVTDLLSGDPVEGAVLSFTFRADGTSGSAVTDETGAWIVEPAPAGTADIEVVADGFTTMDLSQDVEPLTVVQRDIALAPTTGAISVAVTGEGAPLAHAIVTFFDRGIPSHIAQSSVEGQVTSFGRATRTHRVVATHPGYVDGEQNVDVAAATLHELSIVLTPEAGWIVGRITQSYDDEGLSQASVSLFQNDAQVAGVLANSNGNYAFGPFAAGDYELQVGAGDHFASTLPITVPANGDGVRQDVALNGSVGSVQGTIVAADDGTAIVGASVEIFGDDGGLRWAAGLDTRNFFNAGGIPPGPGRVMVSADGFQTIDQAFSLASGETADLELRLERLPGQLDLRVVASFDDAQIEAARVVVRNVAGEVVSETDTSATGRTLVNLTPGDYTVAVSHPEYVSASAGVTITTETTSVEEIGLEYRFPGVVEGFVSDSSGAPIVGFPVALFQAGGAVASATTDITGYYRITNLDAGAYELRFGDPVEATDSAFVQRGIPYAVDYVQPAP